MQAMVKIYNPNTARIHVMPSCQNVFINDKRFQFARNYSDVEVLDELSTELGLTVIVTQTTKSDVRINNQ
jgi:hypothetical protein